MAEKKEKKEEKDSDVFVLKVNTDNAEGILFSNPKLGDEPTDAFITLTNPTKERYAFKVKCTSNEMFQIKRPIGLIGGSETVEIPVSHLPGKKIPVNSKQYFAVHYTKTTEEEEKDERLQYHPRTVWETRGKKFDGVKRIYISFAKPGGTINEGKKDEKKDSSKQDDGKKDGTKEEEKKEDNKKKEEKKIEKKDEDKK